MKGKCIVIAGGTGTGKSTIVKSLLAGANPANVLLYDVNNEHPNYTEKYKNPYTQQVELPELDDFLLQCKLSRNCIIAVEEATMFFSNKGRSDEMVSVLVRKRHTMNNIILVYHSLRSMPKYILDFVNYLVILKTTIDTEKTVEELGRDEITQAWKEIRDSDWLFTPEGYRYSPNKMLFIS